MEKIEMFEALDALTEKLKEVKASIDNADRCRYNTYSKDTLANYWCGALTARLQLLDEQTSQIIYLIDTLKSYKDEFVQMNLSTIGEEEPKSE